MRSALAHMRLSSLNGAVTTIKVPRPIHVGCLLASIVGSVGKPR